MALYIPNVGEASKMIVTAYVKEDFDRLNEIKSYLENKNVAKRIGGSADDFHNASVQLAKIGFYDYAFALLLIGVSRYPYNTDILADILCYGLRCRTISEIKEFYENLVGIKDYRLWTWRAFQFSFDYLMEEYKSNMGKEDDSEIEKEIERIIADFQKESEFFDDQSDREKAYLAEYEYYMYKRNREKAVNAIEKAIAIVPTKCAQCALKYADYLFGAGNYAETIKYATIAVNVKEDQESISKGYAYYILGMSQESVLRETGGSLSADRIKPIYNSYNSALIFLSDDREDLKNLILKQVEGLEYESGIDSCITKGRGDNAINNAVLRGLMSSMIEKPQKQNSLEMLE